jgi:hypothetical protein
MPPESEYPIVCPLCGEKFRVLIARIRSKRSRGTRGRRQDGFQGFREFDVRIVKLSGQEELIQFCNFAYSDFELRQGDDTAFYYVGTGIRLVQNFTIGEIFKVAERREIQRPCYLATYVYGLESDEVAVLRQFRDDVLIPHSILSLFVHLYYWVSPKLIRLFGASNSCKKLVAAGITPVVWIVRKWAKNRTRRKK